MIIPYYEANEIKRLWYSYTNDLGILYPEYLTEQINSGRVFVYLVNNIVAGFATYSIKNSLKEVSLDALLVLPSYRDRGIGLSLLHRVYKETESLFKTLGFVLVVDVLEHSDSNSFWNKVAYNKETYTTRSGKTRFLKYYLDLIKLDQL